MGACCSYYLPMVLMTTAAPTPSAFGVAGTFFTTTLGFSNLGVLDPPILLQRWFLGKKKQRSLLARVWNVGVASAQSRAEEDRGWVDCWCWPGLVELESSPRSSSSGFIEHAIARGEIDSDPFVKRSWIDKSVKSTYLFFFLKNLYPKFPN